MISGVVFDFDGTLVDSNQVKIQAFYDIVKSYDPEGHFVREVLQQCANEDRYSITRHLARRLIAKGQIPLPSNKVETLSAQLADTYTTTCQKNILTCPEVPGASVLLQWLSSRHIPAFINSRTPVKALNPLLEVLSFTRYFSGVYGAPASKLENLRHIQKMTGINPEKILFVGDSDDDVIAATEFGCHFAGVILRDNSRFSQIPARHVKNLEEIKEMVQILQENNHYRVPKSRAASRTI